MVYLAVDTCVWLELLKVDFTHENNYFDEFLFWIEAGHIQCVTTENLVREWNRNKVLKKQEITKAFKEKQKEISSVFTASDKLDSIYETDKVEEVISRRISRIDFLLSHSAIVAQESDEIYLEAVKRNIDCLAPNHAKDSFRDTLNILTLKKHIKDSGYPRCIFTTINHKDFCETPNKYKLHNQLVQDFKESNLEYVYFDNDKNTYSGRLFGVELRPILPSFSEYLKQEKQKEENRLLSERKIEQQKKLEIVDKEFISNIQQIDRMLLLPKRSSLDEEILEILFKKHPRYKAYFLKKLAENGLV